MSRKPEPFRSLSGEIGKDRTTARAGRNASPFFGTGIHPTGAGGMESDAFDGDLATDDAGTTGWAFNDQKVAVGELILRPGSIGNDALTNPVVPAQAFQGASTFALTVAGGNIITVNRTVPVGFTSAVVSAYGRLAAINSTASDDAVYCAVDVNGSGGNQFGIDVPAGKFGSLSAGYGTLLTGLTAGATIATHLYGSTGLAGWASDPSNGADLSVTYLWFR
jgi:hypothetical protein